MEQHPQVLQPVIRTLTGKITTISLSFVVHLGSLVAMLNLEEKIKKIGDKIVFYLVLRKNLSFLYPMWIQEGYKEKKYIEKKLRLKKRGRK